MTQRPALDPGWLRELKRRIDSPPERARQTLALRIAGGAASIGSIEPALASRLAQAALPVRDAGGAWWIELAAPRDVDPALGAIARWLRDHGVATGWRDELLSVEDDAGRELGAIERAAVRPLGVRTRAVHLVVTDAQGRLWIQQRAFDKATDPGLWDTTMGGLVSAGESIAQTLERETWEEAGLRLADLRGVATFGHFTARRPMSDGYVVERIDMFEAAAPSGLIPANQDGEVECFECVEMNALVDRLHGDRFTLEAAAILAAWLERDEAHSP